GGPHSDRGNLRHRHPDHPACRQLLGAPDAGFVTVPLGQGNRSGLSQHVLSKNQHRLFHEGVGSWRPDRRASGPDGLRPRVLRSEPPSPSDSRDLIMFDRIGNIFRLGVKELLGVRSDVVLVLLIIYSFTYSVYGPAHNSAGELANASVGIVDEDHSESSR